MSALWAPSFFLALSILLIACLSSAISHGAGNYFRDGMDLTSLLHRIQLDLFLNGPQYKFYIEIAAVAVLLYVGFTDFRTFKIRNDVLILLVLLYVLLAIVSRSWIEIIENVILATFMFAVLLWFCAESHRRRRREAGECRVFMDRRTARWYFRAYS